jgi:internalin A
MAADEVQRLDLKDLDAVLARAKSEAWTELALVVHDLRGYQAEALVRSKWPAARVFVLNERLRKVPSALIEIDSLASLVHTSDHIGDAGATTLTQLAGLTSLHLQYNQIADAGATALARLTRLTSLNLRYNQIGDAGATGLARLTGLTSLDLRGNQVGDVGATALARLTGLTSLDLRANQIGDAGATALARLTGLTSLDLRKNRIGNAGATALARLTGLTSLDLRTNRIGNAGARAILDAWADRRPATLSQSDQKPRYRRAPAGDSTPESRCAGDHRSLATAQGVGSPTVAAAAA